MSVEAISRAGGSEAGLIACFDHTRIVSVHLVGATHGMHGILSPRAMRLAQTAATAADGLYREAMFRGGETLVHGSELYCRIETPKGAFVAQRAPLERWMPSPADCCYFPDTVDRAGRPLEAIVCSSQPGAAGGQVSVKPVALLRVNGRRGWEDVVLCVALDEPSWDTIERAHDLPAQLRDEIQQFLSARSARGGLGPSVAWCSRDDALTAIDDAAARWAATVNGHG